MRRKIYVVSIVLINLLLTALLLEAGLRAFPQLIPMKYLLKFSPPLRSAIATRLNLPTLAATRLLKRDDGGPALRTFLPGAVMYLPPRDEGAVTTMTMDERGFCNPANAAPAGHSDIVTIGDSFTFCTAVTPESTWTVGLGRLMGRTAYNLGRVGIGLHEYLQIYANYGAALTPRLVVMNVYEGNDMRDAYALIEARRRGAEHTVTEVVEQPWVLDHSYATALVAALSGHRIRDKNSARTRGYLRQLRRRYGKQDFHYDLRFPGGTVAFNGENGDTDEVLFARAVNDNLIEPQLWETWREALRAFVELGRRQHFTPVVSYTPSAYTTYADVVSFHDHTLTNVMPRFSKAQRDFFRAEAAKLGYTYVDLTPALHAATARQGAALLYRPYNLHLTPEGHAVIADALHTALSPLLQ